MEDLMKVPDSVIIRQLQEEVKALRKKNHKICVKAKEREVHWKAYAESLENAIADLESKDEEISADDILSIEIVDEKKDDERKGEILEEIAKLGEKISDLIEEYEGDIIIEINQYEVLLRNSGDILYRK